MATTTLQRINGYKPASAHNSINLNWPERYVSIAAGVKLSLSGIKNLVKSPFASILKLGAAGYLLNRGFTGHCELYSQVGKINSDPVNIRIKSSFKVNKSRQYVYEFWRKLDNLPLFMNHLESVNVIDNERSHWVLKLPTGVAKIGWDTEIVMDVPYELIGWSSAPGSVIDNAGRIRFRDTLDGGTLIDLIISYQPPVGGLGAGLAQVLNPVFKSMIDADVQNFKQYMDLEDKESMVIIVD